MNEARLLSVHPHPDDETIACGGVLARYAEAGAAVHVVVCTAGEEGENLAGIDLGDEDIVTHRRRELADALEALGVTGDHRLGYRDSGMEGTEANDHPDSFHRADLDEAAGRLAAVIRAVRPHVVISDDRRGGYGHPDHIKANRVTVRAVGLAADPGAPLEAAPWQVAKRYVHTIDRDRMRRAHDRLVEQGLPSPFDGGDDEFPDDVSLGTPAADITTRVDVHPWLDRKRAALRAHRSQIGEESFFFNLPGELADEVFGVEEFILEDVAADGDAPPADGPETDLFAGLRTAGPGP